MSKKKKEKKKKGEEERRNKKEKKKERESIQRSGVCGKNIRFCLGVHKRME